MYNKQVNYIVPLNRDFVLSMDFCTSPLSWTSLDNLYPLERQLWYKIFTNHCYFFKTYWLSFNFIENEKEFYFSFLVDYILEITFHTTSCIVSCCISVKHFFIDVKWICMIWFCVLIILIIKWLLSGIQFICVPGRHK